MLGTRKKHNFSRGRKVSIRSEKISVQDAMQHLMYSKRTGAWPQFRVEIGKLLPTMKPQDAYVLDTSIDGNAPTEDEIKSVEMSMNKFLSQDLKASFLVHYADNIGRFILAPTNVINSIIGSKQRGVLKGPRKVAVNG